MINFNVRLVVCGICNENVDCGNLEESYALERHLQDKHDIDSIQDYSYKMLDNDYLTKHSAPSVCLSASQNLSTAKRYLHQTDDLESVEFYIELARDNINILDKIKKNYFRHKVEGKSDIK